MVQCEINDIKSNKEYLTYLSTYVVVIETQFILQSQKKRDAHLENLGQSTAGFEL